MTFASIEHAIYFMPVNINLQFRLVDVCVCVLRIPVNQNKMYSIQKQTEWGTESKTTI